MKIELRICIKEDDTTRPHNAQSYYYVTVHAEGEPKAVFKFLDLVKSKWGIQDID